MRIKSKIKLQEKGWGEEEIKHAEYILEKADRNQFFLSKIVFWSALLVIIFANIIVSLILVPFLIIFNPVILYGIVIILGATIGFLYNFLISDVTLLEKKHHLMASLIIPLLALVNIMVVVYVSNQLIMGSKIQNKTHDPVTTALIFALAFILPYILGQIIKMRETVSPPPK